MWKGNGPREHHDLVKLYLTGKKGKIETRNSLSSFSCLELSHVHCIVCKIMSVVNKRPFICGTLCTMVDVDGA